MNGDSTPHEITSHHKVPEKTLARRGYKRKLSENRQKLSETRTKLTETTTELNVKNQQLGQTEIALNAANDISEKDSLTEIYNNRGYMRRLREMMETIQRDGGNFTYIILDVNFLKEKNDLEGHVYGDALLRNVAAILRDNIRITDTAARIGGDEFALLLPNLPKEQLNELWLRLSSQFDQENLSLAAGATVITADDLPTGKQWRSINALGHEEELKLIEIGIKAKADEPMYSAKNDCKNPSNPNFGKSVLKTRQDLGYNR